MKEQPFYKKGIGHPLQQTETNDLLYIDQPLHQNGTLDPLRGDKDKKTDKYTHYTDPSSGTQGKLDSGRSYAQAYKIAKEKGLSPEGESQSDYAKFAKWQLGSYRDTGVWKSRDDYKNEFQANTDAGVITPNNNSTSSSGNTNPTTSNEAITGDSIVSRGFDTATKDFDLPKYSPQDIDLSGGRKAGLVRQFDSSKGGFQGEVLDQQLMKSGTDRSSIRQLKKGIKGSSKSYGATGREARAQAQLAKAVRLNAAAGLTTRETDASGKTINESSTKGLGLDSTAAAGGKARKKAAKAMRRFNRMQHRMKSHEGHNIDPKGIGSQYYGKGDVYNKPKGSGDGRNAQLRAAGGPGAVTVGNTNTQDLLNNEVNSGAISSSTSKKKKKKTPPSEFNKSIDNLSTMQHRMQIFK